MGILFADRRKSSCVLGAAIAIFADRRDRDRRRKKSPISDMPDIGDFFRRSLAIKFAAIGE